MSEFAPPESSEAWATACALEPDEPKKLLHCQSSLDVTSIQVVPVGSDVEQAALLAVANELSPSLSTEYLQVYPASPESIQVL